jgi:hypothetical protein
MINKIAIDLDGVIVDFLRGAVEAGIYNPETGKMDEQKLEEADDGFWANLPTIIEGMWLYSRLYAYSKKKDFTLYVLSHAINDAAREGKKQWLEKNLHINPMNVVFVSKRRDKNDFADSETLLIDDYQKNCEEFTKAGGQSVLFHRKDMKKTLDDLRVFLNEIE